MQHTRKRAGLLKSALLGAATLGALSLAGAGVARADTLEIGYSLPPSATINTITTSSSGTIGLPATPSPYKVGPANNFTISSLGGTGTPILNEPALLTNTTDVTSSGGGELIVYVTETGLTMPQSGYYMQTLFTNNGLNHASVVMTDFYDTTNNAFGMQHNLNTATFVSSNPVGGLGTNYGYNSILPLGSPFSLTVEYDISFTTGGGFANVTVDTSSVPEPGSLALLGAGLLGLGLVARRRRRKA